MNIIAVYPAFDVVANEMAAVWQSLCRSGRISCVVLASSEDVLKGTGGAIPVEEHPNLRIVRSRRGRWTDSTLRQLVAATSPDVIFCAVMSSLPTALRIQRLHWAPIVLHTEFLRQGYGIIRRRDYLGIPLLRPLAARRRLGRVLSSCRVVLCSDPRESREEATVSTGPVRYLPWPHFPRSPALCAVKRDSRFSAHVGSISRRKGAKSLGRYYGALLRADPKFRVSLVGPCLDRAAREAVAEIEAAGGCRAQYLSSCSRYDALRLISSSLFVLSPGNRLGWGLIADAWSCETPLLAVSEHYDLEVGKNCLIAANQSEFVDIVRAIREDPQLRHRLASGGSETAGYHAIERVASQLHAALRDAIAID